MIYSDRYFHISLPIVTKHELGLPFPARNLPIKFGTNPSTIFLVIVVTVRHTEAHTQTNAGKNILPRFRGENERTISHFKCAQYVVLQIPENWRLLNIAPRYCDKVIQWCGNYNYSGMSATNAMYELVCTVQDSCDRLKMVILRRSRFRFACLFILAVEGLLSLLVVHRINKLTTIVLNMPFLTVNNRHIVTQSI